MEGWKDGRMEGWKAAIIEDERMKGWKDEHRGLDVDEGWPATGGPTET